VPPIYKVCKGWDLTGFHSEVEMVASEYLSSLTYPERIWTSLISYENYADFKNNRFADGISNKLQPDDYMKPAEDTGCTLIRMVKLRPDNKSPELTLIY